MGLTDWDKLKEKKIKNIGFISRSNAFREPTEAERAAAVARETESWQATKGVKPYTLTAEYSTPKGHGVNLKQDTQFDIARKASFRLDAIEVYCETPMEVPFEKPIEEIREYLFVIQTIIFIVSLLFLALIMRKGFK